ncbi:hypothetical protein CDL15_Pgr013647 [Punica granatum]|uniref:NPK1-activating kinesin-like protein C-terminal domain-containing protein n=1 Tax=Punica granatum TaxID=22663 RepID=A0A218W2A0_PUNGR|nr:hypothetical protein CDL15_Pgr013647 [Punica granatum]
MQKKVSTIDGERLFLTWGIGLDSKNRSLQLACRLWTRTDDIDHISESASIVAMLVGLVPAEDAPKEMSGLNFAPRGSGRRSNVFKKGSVISIVRSAAQVYLLYVCQYNIGSSCLDDRYRLNIGLERLRCLSSELSLL